MIPRLSFIPTSHKQASGAGRWLLSLADLVTLLLAVTAISLTSGRLETSSSPAKQVEVSSSGVGIVIAVPVVETFARTVFLYEEAFSVDGQSLTEKASNSIEELMNCQGSCSETVEVMSCSPELEVTQNAVWHESLLRLLTLHRHLFDEMGSRAEGITMTSLGSHCELLGYAGEVTAKTPVMAVRLKEDTEVRHG